MMTVKEVSALTGVSIRALQYYDQIGLFPPTEYTEAGYRLYDDAALERLQQILLFRELEFPLKEIGEILRSPDFDRDRALEQQIELLTLKKEHLEKLIDFARGIRLTGGNDMDFTAFDKKKIEEYRKEAKERWGQTREYREFEEKARGRTEQDEQDLMKDLLRIFAEFGKMKSRDPGEEGPQRQVKKLQAYITGHFYRCTEEILYQLGQMYACGGEFTENIDAAGGSGTARFTAEAIRIYCGR